LTLAIAILFLNEYFTWVNILGTVFVIAGIFMIVGINKRPIPQKHTGRGVALSLAAAALWAVGSITLKIALNEVDTYVAAAIRVTTSALLLTALAFNQNTADRIKFSRYGPRNLILVASAGLLSYGVGAIGYVTAIYVIGAGKTALLSTSAPVFLLPLSVFILKEKPSRLALAGMCVSVIGIWLVAL
jgi:drug/metabolite transporter (DMT)-like permease